MGNCVPEAKQKANGEGHGGALEHRRRVGRFGGVPEVYVTVVFSERIGRFEPGLAVKAEEAHGWSALVSRRVWCRWFGIGFLVIRYRSRV